MEQQDTKAVPAYQPVQQATYQPVGATGPDSNYSVQVIPTLPTGPDPSTTYEPRPDNYMILAIITFCCCMGVPTIFCSVIAVIYSLQVDLAWEVGHRDRAKNASKHAKTFSIAAIMTGVGIVLGVIALNVTMYFTVIAANNNDQY